MNNSSQDTSLIRKILNPLKRLYICVNSSDIILDFDKTLLKVIPSLEIGSSLKVFLDFDSNYINSRLVDSDYLQSTIIIKCKSKELNFKAIVSRFSEDLYIFYLAPVVSYEKSISLYNLTISDFAKLDFISEFIFLQQISGKGLEESQMLIKSLRKKNEELEVAKKYLVDINSTLELRVDLRTQELRSVNAELKQSNSDLVKAIAKQQELQNELVKQEKLSALGALIASIAHEINTPLGAIKAANNSISEYLQFEFNAHLKLENIQIFQKAMLLLGKANMSFERISTREFRVLSRDLLSVIQTLYPNLSNSTYYSNVLIEMGIKNIDDEILDIFNDKYSEKIFAFASNIFNVQKSTALIGEASNRAIKIIKALNTFSHPNVNQSNEVFNLYSAIEGSLVIIFDKIKRIKKLSNNVPTAIEISGNAEELSQVIVNIVNNAIQASNFDVEINIDYISISGYHKLEISNNGPMIPLEIQSKIFDEFFTTKGLGEGTGLGLNICRKLVEQMRGTLTFTSDEKLTSFIVLLPK